jgi:hypothetical protein
VLAVVIANGDAPEKCVLLLWLVLLSANVWIENVMPGRHPCRQVEQVWRESLGPRPAARKPKLPMAVRAQSSVLATRKPTLEFL